MTDDLQLLAAGSLDMSVRVYELVGSVYILKQAIFLGY